MRLGLFVLVAVGVGSIAVGCAQGGGGTPDGSGGDTGTGMDTGSPSDSGTADSARTDGFAGRQCDRGQRGTARSPTVLPPTVLPPTAASADSGTPDAGVCAEMPCRLAPVQCGCPTGEACYLSSTGAFCGSAGTIPEGGACTGAADCAPGMVCAGGLCYRTCDDETDCPGRGSDCILTATGDTDSVDICSIPCEPVTGSGCPSGFACRVRSVGSQYFTDCVNEGAVPPGGDCSSGSCTAGYTCVQILFDFTCLGYCRLGAGDCFLCTSFVDGNQIIDDGTEYGWCP